MNYLFFDIECCDGIHICEFGYIVINDKFEVLERDCITINPERKFNLGRRKSSREITLAFSDEEYYNSPNFFEVYDKIKGVITKKDCEIIGFSVKDDNKFLATAWDRYKLKPIKFKFYDMQKLYTAYAKIKNPPSVEKMMNELGLEDVIFHKSDNDAYAVMLSLKVICERENLTIPETLKKLCKINNNYKIEQSKDHILVKTANYRESTPTTIGELLNYNRGKQNRKS